MARYVDAEVVEMELKRRVAGNCLLCDRYESCIDAGLNRKGSHRHCWHPKQFPAADVQEVRHGKWLRQGGRPEAICSECGCDVVYQVIDNRWRFENYCPHCGAKMDGKD